MNFDVCLFGKVLRSASALVVLALIAQSLCFFTPARAQSPEDFAASSREIPELAHKGEIEQAVALAFALEAGSDSCRRA